MLSALVLAAALVLSSRLGVRAQVVESTLTPTITPAPLPLQSAAPDSRDWDGPRTSDIILFVAFVLGCTLFAYLFYAYTVKRRRRAHQAQWDGAYGPGGYGDAHARAFARPQFSPSSGYDPLATPPAYTETQYPPPPLYAQAPYQHQPDKNAARPLSLSRGPSSASTSTLIGYSGHKDTDKRSRRLSEDDEDEDEGAQGSQIQPARPQPAHKSSWRGRFARLGDRA
ncbi:hypothetical protein CC85DRAFT_287934 [Cutaneotrichosporon oleaginosum]|uniref:Transmembrane protein n=1 Tax=Cutaneotrichosporon oleaginosum TaxID=879819 RepID=A0A0J1AXK7_9TREE|nr:uncharacterized protein CC85DRAFT_287934 [Cutaneotrichosporon oleaginosum]KLT40049.1 hypothetical protein CC85DRAFT_287934 [Cutaneotrichosporon oleaginosum]TXT13809.1 hypothetical protein COLE_00002 [Cutaneotrichosporon oleaginosum]